MLVGLQHVAVTSFSVNLGGVLLRPGGVMGPETVQTAWMKLTAVSEEGRGSALFRATGVISAVTKTKPCDFNNSLYWAPIFSVKVALRIQTLLRKKFSSHQFVSHPNTLVGNQLSELFSEAYKRLFHIIQSANFVH